MKKKTGYGEDVDNEFSLLHIETSTHSQTVCSSQVHTDENYIQMIYAYVHIYIYMCVYT